MKTFKLQNKISILLIIWGISNFVFAQEPSKKKDILTDYLVDVAPAPIAAASLIGVTGSGISTVQDSQDLALAISPFISGGSKVASALAINPGRTTFFGVSGRSYFSSPAIRAASNITFSYAQNFSEIASVSYKKTAWSVSTYHYYHVSEDPVLVGYAAFLNCDKRKDAQTEYQVANNKYLDDYERLESLRANQAADKTSASTEEIVKLKEQVAKEKVAADLLVNVPATEQAACDRKAQTDSKWNYTRFMVSYGDAKIFPDIGGNRYSLGKSISASAIIFAGTDRAVYATFQKTKHAVDTATLSKIPAFKNTSLIALRYASGSASDSTLRYLVEISNAGKSDSSKVSSIYKYAVGIDKKISKGVWAQIRYGRSTTSTGESLQNKSIFNLAWAPSATLND